MGPPASDRSDLEILKRSDSSPPGKCERDTRAYGPSGYLLQAELLVLHPPKSGEITLSHWKALKEGLRGSLSPSLSNAAVEPASILLF